MGNVLIDNVEVKGKSFNVKLDVYTCFYKAHGICSLDLSEEDVSKYPDFNKSGVLHCRSLYENIKDNGVKFPVLLSSHKCGHYGISDGQHRICICGRKGIKLPVYLDNNDIYKCRYCLIKEKGYLSIEDKNYPWFIQWIRRNRFLNPKRYRPDSSIINF